MGARRLRIGLGWRRKGAFGGSACSVYVENTPILQTQPYGGGSWIVLYMLIIELAVSAMFTALYTALSARDVCLRAVPFFKVLAVVRVLPGVLWTLILDFRYAGVIQLCWTPVSSPGPTCRSQVGSRCHRVHAREVCIVARLLIRAVDLWSGIGARNVTS